MDFIIYGNNHVVVLLASGKQFGVVTDNGTAYELALELTDWSALFEFEDRCEEVTQIVRAS